MTPYQALYGCPPPVIIEVSIPGPDNVEARDLLAKKEGMIRQIKQNLAQAQARMKKYANKNWSKRTLKAGDIVYLKMQLYRLATFGLRRSMKLTSKFYGPFRILQNVGSVAYRLQLLLMWAFIPYSISINSGNILVLELCLTQTYH